MTDPNTSPIAALNEALRRASEARDSANAAASWVCRATELFEAAKAELEAPALRPYVIVESSATGEKMRSHGPPPDDERIANVLRPFVLMDEAQRPALWHAVRQLVEDGDARAAALKAGAVYNITFTGCGDASTFVASFREFLESCVNASAGQEK